MTGMQHFGHPGLSTSSIIASLRGHTADIYLAFGLDAAVDRPTRMQACAARVSRAW